jgi:hypothetical protein
VQLDRSRRRSRATPRSPRSGAPGEQRQHRVLARGELRPALPLLEAALDLGRNVAQAATGRGGSRPPDPSGLWSGRRIPTRRRRRPEDLLLPVSQPNAITRACGSDRRSVRIAAPACSLPSPASTKMTSGRRATRSRDAVHLRGLLQGAAGLSSADDDGAESSRARADPRPRPPRRCGRARSGVVACSATPRAGRRAQHCCHHAGPLRGRLLATEPLPLRRTAKKTHLRGQKRSSRLPEYVASSGP